MTPLPNDSLLLARFLRRGDHAAFRELTERYLPVAYSAALRITESPELAADVAQDVFLRLAQGPFALMKGVPLAAWLHRTTRHRALDLLRAERSRAAREQAAAMVTVEAEAALPSEALSLLDEVIDHLPAGDRALVVQRFFSGESFAAISQRTHLSEDAVRMRLNRALEKMRQLFARRGVKTTAALLAGSLPAQAATAPPAALQAGILTLTLAQGAAAPASAGLLSLLLMTTSQKLMTGAAALVAIAAVTVAIVNHSSSSPAPATAAAAGKSTTAAADGSPATEAAAKPDRNERATIPADLADLEAKYGAARTRQAVALAHRAATLAAAFASGTDQNDSGSADSARSYVHVLVSTLGLDEKQEQALEPVIVELAQRKTEAVNTFTREGAKDRRDVVETMLAADAVQRGEAGKEELDQVLQRTAAPLLSGRMSTVAEACFISRGEKDLLDPFLGYSDLGERFEAVLTPEQKQGYETIRRENTDFSHIRFRLWNDDGSTGLNDFDEHLTQMTKLNDMFSALGR